MRLTAGRVHTADIIINRNRKIDSLPSGPCKPHYTSVGTPVLTLFQHHKIWLCPLRILCHVTDERRAGKKRVDALYVLLKTTVFRSKQCEHSPRFSAVILGLFLCMSADFVKMHF